MKKRTRGYGAALILLSLALVILSGCGSKPEAAPSPTPAPITAPPTPAPSAEPAPAPSAEPTAAPSPEPTEEVTPMPTAQAAFQPTAEDYIHVSSMKELLDAIRPDADILIEPGYYNLTEYLHEIPDWEEWNKQHEYVQIYKEFDGPELHVLGASGLRLEGASDDPAATEIVAEPRYAAVMDFTECPNLTIGCLTMGHTDTGDCTGNVLDFSDCRGILLNKVDLYGCGVYGIGCNDCAGDLTVADSLIRDCAFGPFEIYSGVGEFLFTDCIFTGSGWGGFFDYNDDSSIAFVRCRFGQQESNAWFFDDYAQFEDCTWSEITQYPDYSDYEEWEPPVLDPLNVTQMPADKERINDSYWTGYAQMNPESCELRYLFGETEEDYEYAAMAFDADGTGWLSIRYETLEFSWECTDEESISLTVDDDVYTVSLFAGDSDDEGYAVWLLLYYGDKLYWFY